MSMHTSVTGKMWMVKDIFGNIVAYGNVPEGSEKFVSALKMSKECLTPHDVLNLMEPFIRKEITHDKKH